MNKPNFFIVGAQKAGTTSLFHYLNQHPDIFMPTSRKEPCFFRGRSDSFEIAPPISEDEESYFTLFSDAKNESAIGEASVDYLYYSKKSAFNIRDYNPDARIIIVLRDPIARAYSNYIWALKEGKEEVGSFAEALVCEETRVSEGAGPVWHYKAKGLYFNQVSDFMGEFPRKNIKIILYEDLLKDSVAVCKDIFSFLGVRQWVVDASVIHNPAGIARVPALQRFLNRNSGVGRIGYLLPKSARRWLRNTIRKYNINSDKKAWPELTKLDKNNLREFYKDDVMKLASLINRDLDHWLR